MKEETDTSLRFATARGEECEGHLVQLGRYEAVFQVYGPEELIRASEVLPRLTLKIGERLLYDGKATVADLVSHSGGVNCKAMLDAGGINPDALADRPRASFADFQKRWLAGYRILPEFKIVVADIEIFLVNLRQWVEQMELTLHGASNGDAAKKHEEITAEAAPQVVSAFNALHERFEDISYRVEPEMRGVHQNYSRRRLHPLFLSAPFAHRTYHKPLGYAGDYEMMNMIMRNTTEGSSLFAKLVHLWLVRQWPAESVRNRITHLKTAITEEAARVVRSRRRCRVLNIGCGPAWEVQEFMRGSSLSNEADFTFMDFDAETLGYVANTLNEVKRANGRHTGIETVQTSVQLLLRRALQNKKLPTTEQYDLIYCAGLFDYLSNATCRSLVAVCHQWLNPGGLVVAANMNDTQPFRNMIEFLLDWHLIYRDAAFMASLRPDVPAASAKVFAEPTTVNLFVHVRKDAEG